MAECCALMHARACQDDDAPPVCHAAAKWGKSFVCCTSEDRHHLPNLQKGHPSNRARAQARRVKIEMPAVQALPLSSGCLT